MEPLILEIITRDLHRYHALDKPEIRVGRALDNDVILSDATVAPHHLIIIQDASGAVEIRNLADTNPTRFEGRRGAAVQRRVGGGSFCGGACTSGGGRSRPGESPWRTGGAWWRGFW